MSKKSGTRQKAKSQKARKRHRKLGTAPGTVTYMGNREGTPSSIECITYDENTFERVTISTPEDLEKPASSGLTQWINVVGVSDEQLMSRLGAVSQLNNLVVEDIVNTEQRPKIDEYDHYIFGVFKMLYLNADLQIVKEHVALVLTADRVYVYQEIEADVFDRVRQRIVEKSGRIRSRGADYLFFALLDALVDHYFTILEQTEERLDHIDEEIYAQPTHHTAYRIQQLRKEIINLRAWMGPVKELIGRLIQSESNLISKDTRIFLRDVLDHSLEINETLHIQREMAFSLMEMYMSSMSNRMNEVMKVLTIMASIFIPLTFIAGIYGMNFSYMPELQWKYGYFLVLALMLSIFVILIFYFKRKRWF
ncbi:MAG TPA: magnesium/cobalt transporter CorA [Robiginitalea sp.]|nr:magnesium/cobalt transporter CorA [Robiginitalea sp.]